MPYNALRTCFLLLLISISSRICSQTWTWAKSLGIGYTQGSIESDKQGFIYTTFEFSNPTYSNVSVCGSNPLFLKYDTLGNIVWAQGVSAGGASVLDFAFDAQNNVYVCGIISTSCTFCGGTQSSIHVPYVTGSLPKSFVGKYAANGDLQWITYWADSAAFDGYHIVADAAGNTYVQNYGYTINNTFSGLRKLDPNGQMQWSQQFNAKQNTFIGFYQIETDNQANLYIAGGFRDSVYLGGKSLQANQPQCNICTTAFIAKMDSSGKCLWMEKLGGTLTFIEDLKLDKTGHLYIGGYCQNGCSAGTTSLAAQGFLAKYDTSGNAVWAKTQMPRAKRLVIDSKDNCLAYGTYTLGKNVFGTLPDTVSLTNVRWMGEIFVIKYDQSGKPLWAVSPTTITADGFNHAEEFTIDPFDNLYMAGVFAGASFFGSAVVSATTQTHYEMFFAKMNNYQPSTSGIEENGANSQILIYPNPSSHKIELTVAPAWSSGYFIRIFDLLGNLVYSKQCDQQKVTIHHSELRRGIYMLEVTNEVEIFRQKIIKE